MKDSGVEMDWQVLTRHWNQKDAFLMQNGNRIRTLMKIQEDDGKYHFCQISENRKDHHILLMVSRVLWRVMALVLASILHYYNGKFDYHPKRFTIFHRTGSAKTVAFYYDDPNF